MVMSMSAISAVSVSADSTYFATGNVIFVPEWSLDTPEYEMKADGDIYTVKIPVEKETWEQSFEYKVTDGTWENIFNDIPFNEIENKNNIENASGYIEKNTKEVMITFDPQTLKAGYRCVLASEPESIEREKASIKLGVGQSYTLHYTITPSDALTHCTWSSSDTSVATVNSSGKISAKGSGTAIITVKTSNGLSAECEVIVGTAPENIELDKDKVTLGVGQSCKLTSKLTPEDAYTYCAWSSSDTSVATVTSSGKVAAKGSGTAIITVKTSNGKSAECEVTVGTAPESIELDKDKVTLAAGQSCNLKSTITPEDAYTVCVWSSSDTSVATVTSSGKVAAKGSGTAIITVKTSNGKFAECEVTVGTAPENIELDKTSMTLGVGQSFTLTATVTPDDSYTYCAWSSSDTSVATVNSSGKVSAKGSGTAIITVKTSNGKFAECEVTVGTEPVEIELT